MKLLILNSGSSSLKFQLIETSNWHTLYQGHIDGLGLSSCQYIAKYDGQKTAKKITCKTHTEALKNGLTELKKNGAINSLNDITAIGHRVVHGGEKYYKPTIVTKAVVSEIKKLNILAPLHNPANLEGILACQKLLPKLPNVAIFDTAFHHTIPETAYLYGLPYSFYKKSGIRRYGFHGTSHQYVDEQAIHYLQSKKQPHEKLITCHLGNGCSITAIKNGRSIDTSMGFTPLEGLLMGTRSGDLDPGITYFLHQNKNLSPAEINNLLNQKSGLLGLSELNSDVRELRDAWFNKKNLAAKRALDIFCYRLAKYIGGYLTVLGGLDALIFTAGIGENAWYIRQWVCDYLKFLNLKLDNQKNKTNQFDISSAKSAIKTLVIPTNEEMQIAKETAKIIKKS